MGAGFWVALISAGVTLLFVLGVPIFLVIGLWVVGVSFAIDLPSPISASRCSRFQNVDDA